MRPRAPLAAVLLLVSLVPAAAQTPAPGANTSQTVRAAGMALHDGTLPPGTLTVRVVQGSFSGNVSGVGVTVEQSGQPPKQATTGSDGRAQFAHLAVGATVRALASVSGERLESESIVMPPEAGVRVLLVAGQRFVDTTKAGQVANLPPLADASSLPRGAAGTAAVIASTPPMGDAPTAVESSDGAVAMFRVVMVTMTVLAFLAAAVAQLRKRR